MPAGYIGAMTIRPPAPDQVIQVQPSRTDEPRSTAAPSTSVASGYVSIFVRRDDGPEPGVSIFAVRPDGGEVLVRKVPDSIVPSPGKLSEWGTVSGSGWLALSVDVTGGPWPMILVDLRDPNAKPWVVNEADLRGIGPRWGPTGLVAAISGGYSSDTTRLDTTTLVIADPATHSTHTVSMQGRGLVGSGPSIVWTADGSGIVGGKRGSGTYEVVPIDGGAPRPGLAQVFDPWGRFGPGVAELRICSPQTNLDCPGRLDGRIERVEPDGTVRTIWRQEGNDRALAASFGRGADEYWLTLDHDSGRQVALVDVHDGRQEAVATVNRDAAWQYVAAPLEVPDHSAALVWIDIGAKPAAVLVPLTGAPPTFHTGQFAGFVDSSVSPH